MLRSLRAVLPVLCWVAALVAGCTPDDASAHLIHIQGIEQRLDEPERLIVRGEGMPEGMRGEARLSGVLFTSDLGPQPIDVRAPCRALGKTEVAVELTTVPELSAREGPFSGRVELRFGRSLEQRVVGRLDGVRARLGRAPSLAEQFAELKRAQAFQRSLGVHALLLGDDGLSVAELDPEGPAARAGLSVGDVVIEVAGRPAQLPRDFIGDSSAREVELAVRRGPTRDALRVRVQREPAAPPHLQAVAALGFALGLGLGALLLAALPTQRLWAPRRREYWLSLCLVGSLGALAFVLLDLAPLVPRELGRGLFGGLLAGALVMCCRRLLAPTSRTKRAPLLSPLL
jgi:hypothetical protein